MIAAVYKLLQNKCNEYFLILSDIHSYCYANLALPFDLSQRAHRFIPLWLLLGVKKGTFRNRYVNANSFGPIRDLVRTMVRTMVRMQVKGLGNRSRAVYSVLIGGWLVASELHTHILTSFIDPIQVLRMCGEKLSTVLRVLMKSLSRSGILSSTATI
jgi:hypothetical protein